jgi:hypothetical protein
VPVVFGVAAAVARLLDTKMLGVSTDELVEASAFLPFLPISIKFSLDKAPSSIPELPHDKYFI